MHYLDILYAQAARSQASHECRGIKEHTRDFENAWATSRDQLTWYARNLAHCRSRYLHKLTAAVLLSQHHPEPRQALEEWAAVSPYWAMNPQDLEMVIYLGQKVQIGSTLPPAPSSVPAQVAGNLTWDVVTRDVITCMNSVLCPTSLL